MKKSGVSDRRHLCCCGKDENRESSAYVNFTVVEIDQESLDYEHIVCNFMLFVFWDANLILIGPNLSYVAILGVLELRHL